MEDIFYLLMFVFFVLAPMLEGMRKRGQTKAPPRPPQRSRPTGARERTQTAERDAERAAAAASVEPGQEQASEAEAAESVIPDDLWEILTGERRASTRAPQPEPPLEAEPLPASWDDDLPDEEAITLEPVEEGSVWEGEPWGGDAEPEVAVEEASAAERLARVAAEGQPARHRREDIRAPQVTAPARSRRGLAALGLGSTDELRRAVLLREILGPPKGLE